MFSSAPPFHNALSFSHRNFSPVCVYVSCVYKFSSRIIIFLCAMCLSVRWNAVRSLACSNLFQVLTRFVCCSQCTGSSFSARLRTFFSCNVRYWCIMLGLALCEKIMNEFTDAIEYCSYTFALVQRFLCFTRIPLQLKMNEKIHIWFSAGFFSISSPSELDWRDWIRRLISIAQT